MSTEHDKHYPSRSGQTSLATAIANFTKPRTSHFFDLCTSHTNSTKLYHDVPPSSLSALQRDPSSLAFSIGDWIDGLVACVVDVHCLRSDIVRGRGNNTKETVGHHHAPSGVLIERFHHFTISVTAGTGSDTPFHEGKWRQAEGNGSSNVREALKNCMKAAEWGFLHYPKKT